MSPPLPEELTQIEGWRDEFDRLHVRLRPHAAWSRTHEQMKLHLQGVLGKAERKNGWHLAQAAGDADPYAMQHLLSRSSWDVEGVREEIRRYVREGLEEILARIVDESGFLKKGTKSAGVARQYSGTAGRVENCQMGVFLAYATTSECAYVDAQLYLPQDWTKDPERCREAGIPKGVEFQTKPQLALRMLERAHEVDGPVPWMLGDEVYGKSEELRRSLESREQGYVLAVSCNLRPPAGPEGTGSAAGGPGGGGVCRGSVAVPECRGRKQRAPPVRLGVAGDGFLPSPRRTEAVPAGAAEPRRRR